jgi:hypothetical protein
MHASHREGVLAMTKRKSSVAATTKSKRTKPAVVEKVAAMPATPEAEVSSAAVSQQEIVDGPTEQMIAEAAYFIAERRGFAPGNELNDWLAAELEITSVRLQQRSVQPQWH